MEALLRAERVRLHVETHPTLQADIAARVETEVTRRVEAEVSRLVSAEVDRRVAIEVAVQVQKFLEEIRLARYKMFAASSEAHRGQGLLFNEIEALIDASTDEPEDDQDEDDDQSRTASRPAARGKRRPLPPELPRVDIVIDVPEAQRLCACGQHMVKIGEEVSEQLNIIPMRIEVLRTIRPRYACAGGDAAPVIAPVPPTALPRSNFSAGFLAMLLTVKYVDGLPLNRFNRVLERSGVAIPRQSLARSAINVSKVLQPLHNLARDALLDSAVIHMDETTVQVLKEPDKAPTSQSYMWVQRGGPPGKAVILFDYDPSRSGQVPLRLLEGWQGYLMTDGYEGYNAVVRAGGIEHLICAAHARRKFVDAKRAQTKGKRGRADQAIDYFARLYRIEREFKDATDEQRLHARQTRSLPVLAALREWLDAALPVVAPKTKLGEALAYLNKYWSRLVRYTERGDLPVDNNAVENAIRPFVIGRKGWMFADTPSGAHASAVVYSLVATAQANGHEPYTWLKHVLERLPLAKTVEDIEALLPWNLDVQQVAMGLAA
ncbi:MAG TPA: IS66 family transposase [Pusillimonas sp.]|nr:IS66 family transposase [Pusillimonas sp.]HUH88082.1 IS66 family transposase [Pusillimonas sp.]